MSSEVMEDGKGPILHVLVVGFHHKKGCQVEYSFPPLVPGAPNECPVGWKYLPTLALPDGSHNFDDDTAFFHLPSLTNPKKTIYGISCFRQIPVEKLKNRTEDITRGTVQKSVCVLSSLPLYGHIEVKMSLITHAYFEEGDFSKVSLLEDTYHHLNACLLQNNSPLQNFVGLSVRDFILQWRHKAVLLYKLLLLERRLIFFKSPVQPLCTSILTLLSLHPGMIEQGLEQSACIKLSRPMSPMPNFEDDNDDTSSSPVHSPAPKSDSPNENTVTETDFSINVVKKPKNTVDLINSTNNNVTAQPESLMNDIKTKPLEENEVRNEKKSKCQLESEPRNEKKSKVQNEVTDDKKTKTTEESVLANDKNTKASSDKAKQVNEKKLKQPAVEMAKTVVETEQCQSQETEKSDTEKIDVDAVIDLGEREEKSSLPRDSSMDTLADASCHSNMTTLTHVNIENCGIPLPLFTKGYLCLPYLSLPYIDLLGDVNVRGYVVGATNVLFKQKRQLADVLIEIDGARIESQDPELRRQLHLTTEDLRFADFVVKHVSEEKQDVFLDGVGWEGGDEWIRAQFRVYLLCLLRTSLLQEGSREIEHFNSSFMTAWKETHNYKMWLSGEHPGILEVNPGHPFAGQLSVADMKLRFAHTMQNTESGRKINQAMASTGRAVATTGRAVGGAISQAKGALSSWWSNLLVSPDNRPAICDGEDLLNTLDKSNNMQQSCQNLDTLADSADAPELENNKKNNMQQPDIPDTCELVVVNKDVVIANGDIIGDAKSEHPDRIPYEMGAIHTV